jgi:phospholipid/cholesterol/gamma-HCH transport system permease protein
MAASTHRRSSLIAQFSAMFRYAGAVTELGVRAFIGLFRPPLGISEIVRQTEQIGLDSMVVVVLTAIFSSMVITVQLGVQLARFGSREYIGNIVGLTLTRELGPVLTALMVGGRIGAGIAAQVGSMVVTEQVDAMRSMGADPIKELVTPRVIASVITLPLLTTLADVLGIIGAMFIAKLEYNIGRTFFYNEVLSSVRLYDYMGGIIKTFFFGLTLSLIACHEGLRTEGGTAGVGRATTHAVVVSSIVTLITDFFITTVLVRFGF